jgi:hypothetical protein
VNPATVWRAGLNLMCTSTVGKIQPAKSHSIWEHRSLYILSFYYLFILLVFQRSTKEDIELFINITIGTVQKESCSKIQIVIIL